MAPFQLYKQYWRKHYCTRGFFHLLNYFLGKHLGQRFCASLCDDTHVCQAALCKFCEWITQLPAMWVAQLDHTFLPTKKWSPANVFANLKWGERVVPTSIFFSVTGGERISCRFFSSLSSSRLLSSHPICSLYFLKGFSTFSLWREASTVPAVFLLCPRSLSSTLVCDSVVLALPSPPLWWIVYYTGRTWQGPRE